MRNQGGEAVTGVMVFMMVVMMVLGGMHLTRRDHGGPRNTGNHSHHEHGHHPEKGQEHEHQGDVGNAPGSDTDEQKGAIH